MITVKINGEIRQIDDTISLYDLIHSLGLGERVMAAAVNMTIVKYDAWRECLLREGDTIELLDFVGGG